MKRSIFMAVMIMMVSAGLTAQVATQTREQNKEKSETQAQKLAQAQAQAQAQVQDRKQEKEMDGTDVEKQTQAREKAAKEQKNITKEQKKAEKRAMKKAKRANHGQVVSETARSTESGPGKGEVVSTRAKTQGEAQRAEPGNKDKNAGARGKSVQARPKVTPGLGSGAGRK